MNANAVERKVLVTFKEGVSKDTMAKFFDGIEMLKKISDQLIYFEMHQNLNCSSERGLNDIVSNVFFPEVMTTWRFTNMAELEKFITCEEHIDIAKNYFKPAVANRIVFNCEVATP